MLFAAGFALAARAYAEAAPCGPFDATSAPFQVANAEPGVAPVQPSGGAITTLPEAPSAAPRRGAAGAAERLKRAAGRRRAPGARIARPAGPILCATVARRRTAGSRSRGARATASCSAAVVANQVYATAQIEMRQRHAGAPDHGRSVWLDRRRRRGAPRTAWVSRGGARLGAASGHADLGPIKILALEDGPRAARLTARWWRASSAIETTATASPAWRRREPRGAAGLRPRAPPHPLLLYDLLRGIDRAWREAR
jgi:hypothetical protein